MWPLLMADVCSASGATGACLLQSDVRTPDVPMTAAHFFYHAGWADKLDYVAPGRAVAPLGVVGQVIPWNFPLLMLAWNVTGYFQLNPNGAGRRSSFAPH